MAPLSFILAGMAPLQPSPDDAADRDDRARRDADYEPEQLVPDIAEPHVAALQHIAGCVECRLELFRLAAIAIAESQLVADLVAPDA